MVPAGLLAETEGEGADQLGCGADMKSRSVASCGPCNPTPDPSIFRRLYNGPWGAGTQAHLGQQKVRLTRPPTSPGYRAGKGGARRAECASGVAGWVSKHTHTRFPSHTGRGQADTKTTQNTPAQSIRPPLPPSGTCHHISLSSSRLTCSDFPENQKVGWGCIFSFESSIKSQ